MCGIVGYIGDRNIKEVLLNGLKKLEYRGYDSAGIAVINNKKIIVEKKEGKIENLENLLSNKHFSGDVGIGHTRWATHGKPSDINAHPHCSLNNTFAVVHNGIIENYLELKKDLEQKGYTFESDTDTEIIANLLDSYYSGDMLVTLQYLTQVVKGSYALGVISTLEPDRIYGCKKDSPLIIGVGNSENFIASDVPAILEYTKDVYYLGEHEIFVLEKDKVKIYNDDLVIQHKELKHVEWDAQSAQKNGYPHFMLKEINEQPTGIVDTIRGRLNSDDYNIMFKALSLSKEELEDITHMHIVACGTAYHAGSVGKFLIEKYARVPVQIDVASEFRYKNPILDDHSLLIVISQSGETADTLAALRLAKENNVRVIAVTNVMGSTISREADDVIYTQAGPEIAVASTKAYTTQLMCMTLLAVYLGELKGKLSKVQSKEIKKDLFNVSHCITTVIDNPKTKEIAKKYINQKNIFFLGRGLDMFTAMEGALKMKEISYIHSEAYTAGELKHGPIALIEKGKPIIALCTQNSVADKMLSNIEEIKSRGGSVLAITSSINTNIIDHCDDILLIPEINNDLTPMIAVVYLQILAYYVATYNKCDVDKPKNLAKSVTVE
jgi:glucosamine--fructose-6-phosphate aminotransferase (isomerizing)